MFHLYSLKTLLLDNANWNRRSLSALAYGERDFETRRYRTRDTGIDLIDADLPWSEPRKLHGELSPSDRYAGSDNRH